MHVVVVVQRVKEIGHFLAGRLAELSEVLGEVPDLGGDDCPSSTL